MTIKRDRSAKVMMIHQKAYLEAVLKKFGMHHRKPISTPMDPNAKFEKLADNEKKSKQRRVSGHDWITYVSIYCNVSRFVSGNGSVKGPSIRELKQLSSSSKSADCMMVFKAGFYLTVTAVILPASPSFHSQLPFLRHRRQCKV